MCGISGGVTQSVLSDFEMRNIAKLWFLNSSRGVDGCGLFDHKPDMKEGVSKTHFFKNAEPSYLMASETFGDFLDNKEGMWAKSKPNLIATHARAATKGEKTAKNAHPFLSSSSRFIGCHNGTITGKYPNAERFETDSAALIQTIEELGFTEAIKKFSADSSNFAAALSVLDRTDNILYLYRNTQRPLHCVYRNSTLYWSSAEAELRYAFNFFNSTLTSPVFDKESGKVSFVNDHVFQIPANNVLKFKLGESAASASFEVIPEVVRSYTYNMGGGVYRQNFQKGSSRLDGGHTGTDTYIPPWDAQNSNRESISDQAVPVYHLNVNENSVYSYGANFLAKGIYSYYAAEFDKYFTERHFPVVLAWRLKHPERFKILLQEQWEGCKTDEEKTKFIHESGFSKNLIKKIIRGGGNKFLRKCMGTTLFREWGNNEWGLNKYSEVAVGEKVFKGLSDYVRQHPEEFFPTTGVKPKKPLKDYTKEALGEKNTNIIKLPDKSKEVLYGHNLQYSVNSHADLIAIHKAGCVYCSDKPHYAENLFFINANDYLCEICQDRSVELALTGQNTGLDAQKLQELLTYHKAWDTNAMHYFDLTTQANGTHLN